MGASHSKPFPFLRLPHEIRDQVYTNLLCSFDALPQDVPDSNEKPLDRSRREVDVSILRTNKQIYHEAYEVMVKKNRFIHVMSSVPNYSLVESFQGAVVPVVTVNDTHAGQFMGYSIQVIMCMADKENVPSHGEKLGVMLLGRDDKSVSALCEALMNYNYYTRALFVEQNFVVTFILGRRITRNLIISEDYFSKNNQQSLLQPFRSQLRGLRCVVFIGVSDDLQHSARKDISAADIALETEKLLDEVSTAKEEGGLRFKEGSHQAAIVQW
ncbi:hypothetical protein BDV96DRAFT_629850 [Lophiotrema nucula]|uniref:Uncharacterized protein n=1 Tax=Lophiotrema nucula TaxID=690887 RepID=A0A6A5ZGD6_9PLEO|nr:hypothetical protein BDV96DRAFT_629850 [Lophiotrema nucula]